MRAALALALALSSAPALADPAMTFAGETWTMPIEPADVFGFQVFPASGGRIALAITLKPAPARALSAHTAGTLGEVVTLTDGVGATLLQGPLDHPIERGLFAVTFGDPEDARRMVRRLQGQP